MGKNLLVEFVVHAASKALAPGMIRGWGLVSFDLVIQGFGIDDFGLALGFMVNGVVQRFVLIEDGDLSARIFTHGNLGMPQGVIGSIGLDLVDDPPGLHGQVLGQSAGFLMGEDEIQIISFEQGAMCIVGTARLVGKATVEILPEFRQEGITAVDV